MAAPSTLHGADVLPHVRVDAYNIELRASRGYLGDRAAKGAFEAILRDWRAKLQRVGADPFGTSASESLGKRELDKVLQSDDLAAISLVHAAIRDFAEELAAVIRRFLRLKSWRGIRRITVGGGFRGSRVGELSIGSAATLLHASGIDVELTLVCDSPNDAGLVGAAYLAPAWMFAAHDGILAVDIGGTNMRAGVVKLETKKNSGILEAKIWRSELWRHANYKPTRDEAIDRLVAMLRQLAQRAAKDKLRLAPFIGVGCPGIIESDGTIGRGGQNLPGNWEDRRFNLPHKLAEGIPTIGDQPTTVVMHNDAVVQGLSEVPNMVDVERWAALTIGTGLGNACFSNLPVS